MELLARGHTLITPTSRLSRYLQHQYARRQLEAGRACWETPEVLPWGGWLQKTWDELAMGQGLEQVLLGPHQQQFLWREVISRSPHGKRLLQPATTAREAMYAWSLCRQWLIPIFADDVYLNEDAFAFRQWTDAYQKLCDKNGWTDEASLAGNLAGLIAQVGRTKNIALAGFDEFTPVQKAVFAALKTAGCNVLELPVQTRNEKTTVFGVHDGRGEIEAAARWARGLLEADPSCSIGIVAHNLQALHAEMQSVFDDVFFPAAILVDAGETQRPYAIAHGLPLSQYSVVDAALLILGLVSETLPLDEFGALLRSPFMGKAMVECRQRAQLDACLRRDGESRVTFDTTQWLIKNDYLKARDVPESFIESWQKFRELFRAHNKKQSAAAWAKLFADLLQTFHWPGERPLDSAEYQTVAEWQKQLQRFAALDRVTPALPSRDALSLLRQLIMNASFQPETPEAPIQILGMTGVAAMQFDHLWIMGLHEENWPGKAEPNPFIPLKLQRALGMPDAAPEIKLLQARMLTERLIQSSPDVVLSYPQNEKERELRPSPLLKSYPMTTSDYPHADASHYAAMIYNARRSEVLDDTVAPAIPAGEVVSGGAGLFKDQAACPFRAFARHRLFAEGLDARDIGLDAKARGSLMHDVMEKLWCRLGGSQALLDMPQDQLDGIINDAVQGAVTACRKQFPLTFTARFTQLEIDRLRAMIRQLLAIERERRPFTVHACEHWHRFIFNDITISTRIDRIDQLVDGRYVIMDYKTGDPKVSQWFSDRPDEPQLPLYAITTEGELAAIVFTRLQKDSVSFIGLAQEDGILPGVKTVTDTRQAKDIPDWETLFKQWRQTLEQLARGFREGRAVVDPKDAGTCRYCDLHALCRIYEKQATTQ
jgi:probable DNA repair protein